MLGTRWDFENWMLALENAKLNWNEWGNCREVARKDQVTVVLN